MSETALRNYLHNIDQIIEQKHYDEAVAHCKHVLGHYPKNLEAYRLLAKALLEKGRHGDAADIFQRVLSVAPDDFLAHVGMAIVREDEANLSAALWHMERAFEANPSNPAIQEELKRLYGRRDGMPPARARLTRGALARMYLKGELYPQAEAELRTALMDDPERLDLTAMLARVLLETGRRSEAADLCHTVLQKLPYNQEANRVLAEILKHQGREPEAKPYQQRLEALDPYEAFADSYNAQNVKPEAVTLPELILDREGEPMAPRKPDWAEALGEDINTDVMGGPSSVFSTDEPEWLKTGTDSLMGGGPLPVTGELPDPGEVPDWLKNVEPLEAAPATAADLPDWMKATTGMAADRPAETGAAIRPGTNKLTGWLTPPPGQAAAPAGNDDLPDWMKDLQPPVGGVPTAPFADDFAPTAALPNDQMPTMALSDNTAVFGEQPTSVLPTSGGGFQEDLPDWLKPPEPAKPTAASDLPDWLKSSTVELSANISSAMLSGNPPEEIASTAAFANMTPEWLKTMAAEGEATDQTEALPDWLKNATGQLPATPPPPAPSASVEPEADAGDLPDWLKNATGQLTPPAAPISEPVIADTGDLPAWLQGTGNLPSEPATGEEAFPWLAENPNNITTPDSAEVEAVPDWIQQSASNEPPAEPVGDVPDWLKVGTGLLSTPSPAEPELPAQPVNEAASWLKVETGPLAEPPAEPEAALSDDLPDWLKGAGVTSMLGGGAAALASMMDDKPEPTPEPRKAFPADIELPDFLQPASAEAIARAETPVDWDETEAAPANAEAVAEDVPDWIKAMAPPAQPIVEDLPDDVAKVAEDELPDWLHAPTKPTGELPDVLPADDLPLPPAEDPLLSASKPGSSETIRTWLSDKDVPDWLQQARAEAAEPEAQSESATLGDVPDWLKAMQTDPGAEIQPAAESFAEVQEPAMPESDVPDFANMSEDEQMRWLETLAARQGADPAELITQPEATKADGPLLPPTGVLPEALRTQPEEAEDVPAWLTAMQTQPPTEAEPEPAAEPAGEMPDFASLSEDEQMRWLETLAARQGADPAELITQPQESTGPIMPSTGILPSEFAEPAPNDDVPAWLRAMQTSQPEEPAAEPVSDVPDFANMSDDEQMRWLETLAARQGADPAELVTQPPAFEPEEEKPATGPLMPRTGFLPPLPEEPAPDAMAEPVSAMPDFATMSEDEQMQWLETLAARQGADPAELVTQPPMFETEEEKPATGPLMPRTGILPPLPEEFAPDAVAEPVSAMPDFATMSEDEQMQWLETLAARQGADPAELVTQPAEPTGPMMLNTGVLPPLEEEAPAAEPVAAVPDFSSMSDDEQMRWLESLAARQGADPAELVTKPEERFELPPEAASSQTVEAGPPPLAALPPEQAKTDLPSWLTPEAEPATPPDWLKAIQIASAPKTGELQEVMPPPANEPTVDAADADVASMDDDAQMRWLESLAARQGADPAELITPAEERPVVPEIPAEEPEPEPLAGPPDWVKASTEPPSKIIEESPATPAEEEIPAWIKAATHTSLLRNPPPEPEPRPQPKPEPKPQAPPPPAPKPEPAKAESGDARLSRLAEQLTAKRRQRDEEVAARLEKERADREAAMRAVEESMEARRTRRTEGETGSLRTGKTGMLGKPGTGRLSEPAPEPELEPTPDAPEAAPAPRAEAKRRPAPPVEEEEEAPRRTRRRQEPIRLPAGTRLKRSRKSKPKKAAFAGQSARDVLGTARTHLNQREYAPAVEQFEYLIRSGENLKEVVAELEGFVNANENAGVFFRVLGDAYMRSGQLQPALDAYRQALTQM